MRLDPGDIADLRPLIDAAVRATLEQLAETDRAVDPGRIGFTEPEAAALLGVERHALRDARLRGEVSASKIGKRLIYARDELLEFLRRRRAES